MVRCSNRQCIQVPVIRSRGICPPPSPLIPLMPTPCLNVGNNTQYAIEFVWGVNPLATTLAECPNPCIGSYRREIAWIVTCPVTGKVGQCCLDNSCCCMVDVDNVSNWFGFGADEVFVIEEGENDPDLLRLCIDVFGDFQPVAQQGHISFRLIPCLPNIDLDIRFEGAFIQTPLRGDNTCFGYVEAYEITLKGDPLFICQNEQIADYRLSLLFIECICIAQPQEQPPETPEGWENTKEDAEVLIGLTIGSMTYEQLFDTHILRDIKVR